MFSSYKKLNEGTTESFSLSSGPPSSVKGQKIIAQKHQERKVNSANFKIPPIYSLSIDKENENVLDNIKNNKWLSKNQKKTLIEVSHFFGNLSVNKGDFPMIKNDKCSPPSVQPFAVQRAQTSNDKDKNTQKPTFACPNPNTTHTQWQTMHIPTSTPPIYKCPLLCVPNTQKPIFACPSPNTTHNGKLCISQLQHHKYTNVHFCVSQLHKSPFSHVLARLPQIHNGKQCISQPQHHTYTNVHFCVSQMHNNPLLHVPTPIPHIHNGKLCISQPQHHTYTNVHFCVFQIHKSPLLHVSTPIPYIHNGKLCISQPQHHEYTNVHFCVSQIHKSPLLHVSTPIPYIHNGKLCISQP